MGTTGPSPRVDDELSMDAIGGMLMVGFGEELYSKIFEDFGVRSLKPKKHLPVARIPQGREPGPLNAPSHANPWQITPDRRHRAVVLAVHQSNSGNAADLPPWELRQGLSQLLRLTARHGLIPNQSTSLATNTPRPLIIHSNEGGPPGQWRRVQQVHLKAYVDPVAYRHLLSHHSALPADILPPLVDLHQLSDHYVAPYTSRTMQRVISNTRLLAPPSAHSSSTLQEVCSSPSSTGSDDESGGDDDSDAGSSGYCSSASGISRDCRDDRALLAAAAAVAGAAGSALLAGNAFFRLPDAWQPQISPTDWAQLNAADAAAEGATVATATAADSEARTAARDTAGVGSGSAPVSPSTTTTGHSPAAHTTASPFDAAAAVAGAAVRADSTSGALHLGATPPGVTWYGSRQVPRIIAAVEGRPLNGLDVATMQACMRAFMAGPGREIIAEGMCWSIVPYLAPNLLAAAPSALEPAGPADVTASAP